MSCKLQSEHREAGAIEPVADEAHLGRRAGEAVNQQHARAAAAAAVVGDKLVVAGGQNEKQLVPQTEVFDGQSWKDAADLPTPREHLAAMSDGFGVALLSIAPS